METFAMIATLFVVGCVSGWFIELFFRRIFTAKRWVNPGFLLGPYVPLYGFGVAFIYCVFALLELVPVGSMSETTRVILGVIFVGILMTVIEFIAGLIFIKGLKLKLWDYSDRKGNIMGLICPLFSLIWLVCGGLFYAFLMEPFTNLLVFTVNNPWYIIFIGIVLGCMLMDFIVSFYYAKQVKTFNNNADMRYDDMKLSFRREYNFKEKKNHFYGIIDITSDTATNLPDALNEFMSKHPDADIMEHYQVNGTKVLFQSPIESAKNIGGNIAKDVKDKASEVKTIIKDKSLEVAETIKQRLDNKENKDK